MDKLLMKKSRSKNGKEVKALKSSDDAGKTNGNECETFMASIVDIPGPSQDGNNPKENLTMKEYEEHLKKLQAENFNLKLKKYLVEERLSKVSGINDKEQLIKKSVQLKVTYESQQKELDRKQELLFEASKAFEQLQKEHETEASDIVNIKEKEISALKSEVAGLEQNLNQLTNSFNKKCVKSYEHQISELEKKLRAEDTRCQELANTAKTTLQQTGPCQERVEGLEKELKERIGKLEGMVGELEVKEHDLTSANFTLRKLEEEMMTKKRKDEIMTGRLSEKNQMIESLQSSLTSRGTSIDVLEKRLAKEKSATQSLLSKLDTVNFLNITLQEELDTLQSRLRRNASLTSLASFSSEEENYRTKLEELQKSLEEKEEMHKERIRELERQISEKFPSGSSVKQLGLRYKKLEEDHRKACAALKTFVKRTADEQRQRETLNKRLKNQKEEVTILKSHLEKISNNSITSPQIQNDERMWPLVGSLFKPLSNK